MLGFFLSPRARPGHREIPRLVDIARLPACAVGQNGYMAMPMHCTGTLIWFDVPNDDGGIDALVECSDCGYLIVSGSLLDERHYDAPLLRSSA